MFVGGLLTTLAQMTILFSAQTLVWRGFQLSRHVRDVSLSLRENLPPGEGGVKRRVRVGDAVILALIRPFFLRLRPDGLALPASSLSVIWTTLVYDRPPNESLLSITTIFDGSHPDFDQVKR